jgi:hypothetical protein
MGIPRVSGFVSVVGSWQFRVMPKKTADVKEKTMRCRDLLRITGIVVSLQRG